MPQAAPRLRQHAVNEAIAAQLIEQMILDDAPFTGEKRLRLWSISLEMAYRSVDLADCAANQDLGWEISMHGRSMAPADWLARDIKGIESQQDEYANLAVWLSELFFLAFGATAILLATPKRSASQTGIREAA